MITAPVAAPTAARPSPRAHRPGNMLPRAGAPGVDALAEGGGASAGTAGAASRPASAATATAAPAATRPWATRSTVPELSPTATSKPSPMAIPSPATTTKTLVPGFSSVLGTALPRYLTIG